MKFLTLQIVSALPVLFGFPRHQMWRSPVLLALLVLCTSASFSRCAVAQEPSGTGDTSTSEISPSAGSSSPAPSDAEFRESVVRAIELLGSSEFTTRESAAEELMALGLRAVPALRDLSTHHDAEVRLRAANIVQQLTEGDFQRRVELFLSGKDIYFDGWEYFQSRMGTSQTMRELFVEVTKRYPALVEALEGTSRDRADAVEIVVQRIQTAMFIERRSPEPVDVIALLLPVSDVDVPVSPAFESTAINLLRREAGTKIQRDLQLVAPTKALIGDWVERSGEKWRSSVLLMTMEWSIPEGYQLSLRTLGESNDPQLLADSMQVISRFGAIEDVKSIAKFLDDMRPLSENEGLIGDHPQTLVSDVAMATIALLHDFPLSELGWEDIEPHPIYSVSSRDLGFPLNKPELRAKAREKVDALIANPAPKS